MRPTTPACSLTQQQSIHWRGTILVSCSPRRRRRRRRRLSLVRHLPIPDNEGAMAWGGLFLSLGRPTQEQQKSCLAAAGGFNYDAALQGASRPKPSSENGDESLLVGRGFFVNRSRVLVGSGAATFGHAKSALLSWRQLALGGWAEVDPETPVKAGTRLCICYREAALPFPFPFPWVMLPLQIAYVVDAIQKSNSSSRSSMVFAVGSGTLQGHLLAGEERFSVQLDEDDRVWYEVFSFSKPAHVLSALCHPLVRLRQKQFAHQSSQALLNHVADVLTLANQSNRHRR